MNYRPFIGLVASIFLLNVAVCDSAAVLAQSVRTPEFNSAGQNKRLPGDCLTGTAKIAAAH
jgi:hypothetical protein